MAALTERSLRRTWIKSTRLEETNRMLNKLVSEGGWLNDVEALSWRSAGRSKWESRGEVGRRCFILEEMLAKVRESKSRVQIVKKSRQSETEIFRTQVSQNIFKRKMREILSSCKTLRESRRKEHDSKVMGWDGRLKDDPEYELPDEIKEFAKCEIFKKSPSMKKEEPSGTVVVCGEDEDLSVSSKEWQLLARGPKYCIVRGCSEEDMKVGN